ncbi:hypothetical protein RSal33209_0339 [Renibacterium salmoninarum ATCC 33209]|uniref:Uncharacterized protein n=1 Tax=Renibacterium salmoninarum (strain ATCC 33209 / DSM 20767 / JCM 11484 / NBRC 15589 / NCIMB 2235) TaxID=288705 RepID=A9WKT7_RENSM|nr:hypothetical protein [Renibacterium salmoninarum]ABY22095.1 hypothetical protein RSal33209_0339 [Renibacterium salmoninarum ATCC 33209]
MIEEAVHRYGYQAVINATGDLLQGKVPEIGLQRFGGTPGWKSS